ncbi:MAG: tyrosine--tRNA ligase [Candidatus ainarchaeum sp.]|nr:tyrosine--tRNA ligase [Candidatus ainarchaeum sp.]
MDLERKIELVSRPPTEEVLTKDELRSLFETNDRPRHYIGFEISGKIHVGSGVMTALKIKDFLEAGVKPTIFLADFHTWINNKLGGDLEKIREVARGYFTAGFVSLGLPEDKVDYVLASELYDLGYWSDVIRISKATTLARMQRCMVIMGRTEGEAVESASMLYPAMQAADVFRQDLDIVHAGMDQRKVHVLAREVAEKLGKKKPVAVHAHLLQGLQQASRMGYDVDARKDLEISGKMSKSKPGSCIYIHDSVEEISGKLKDAYCPPKTIEGNPVMELCEYVLMREEGKPLAVERPAKFGGNAEFGSIAELKKAYSEGALHPMDLKGAAARELSALLAPCREYFAKRPELIAQINEASVTR